MGGFPAKLYAKNLAESGLMQNLARRLSGWVQGLNKRDDFPEKVLSLFASTYGDYGSSGDYGEYWKLWEL